MRRLRFCQVTVRMTVLWFLALAIALPVVSTLLAPSPALAATSSPPGAYLVKDINSATKTSSPGELANGGGTLYFSAYGCTVGVPATCDKGGELWASDGTEAGTRMVKDISPGPGSSEPGGMTYVDGAVFFAADDGSHGRELWKTDGTTAGTALVKDILPDATGSGPGGMIGIKGILFFVADDGIYGPELWKSDGTAGGTTLVLDIQPGSGGSGPSGLIASGGTLFFSADDGVHGRELWRSDGTEAGTVPVKDINPGPSGGFLGPLVNANGILFFFADDAVHGRELWKSDGTEAGTVMVRDSVPGAGGLTHYAMYGQYMAASGGRVFFNASRVDSSDELWMSDGTEAGTFPVKPGMGGDPQRLTDVNGILFFTVAGGSLFKTDGTGAGTLELPVNAGWGSASGELRAVDGKLFFFGTLSAPYDFEPWLSDGTAAGTMRIKDIVPGQGWSYPSDGWEGNAHITDVNSIAFFLANSLDAGVEVWRSDGTEAGTKLVKDINTRTAGSGPVPGPGAGGVLFFSANDGQSGSRAWMTDGTEGGTFALTPALRSVELPPVIEPTLMGGSIYYSADDRVSGSELWKGSAKAAAVTLVKDINPGSGGSGPTGLANANGTLCFAADDGAHGRELWKSDGTAPGTVLLKDINPGGDASSPEGLFAFNGSLCFRADDGTHGQELWKSDGTAGGTALVADIAPGAAGSSPGSFIPLNNAFLFTADDGTRGVELWRSDGTAAGTLLVKDINLGGGSNPDNMVNVNGMVFFLANDGNHGRELWRSDGTTAGTILLKDINPGSGSILNGKENKFRLAVAGHQVFFIANDRSDGVELWKSDGTPAGTGMVKDVWPGSGSGITLDDFSVPEVTGAGSKAFFRATDGVHGQELWSSDGTAQGTLMVKEFTPGSDGTQLERLTGVNQLAYLLVPTASPYTEELWVSDGTAQGTRILTPSAASTFGGRYRFWSQLPVVGSRLYFVGASVDTGLELWAVGSTTHAGLYLPLVLR